MPSGSKDLQLPADVVAESFNAESLSSSGGSSGANTPVRPPFFAHISPFLSPAHNSGTTPDDSELPHNIPLVQHDYLSAWEHEEDIWSSWKATTKQKTSLVNGLRLENASWRQWNKQRNNLKTISPETLNWLKDSDVTWLYGPLHSGPAEIEPKVSRTEDRLGLESKPSSPKKVPSQKAQSLKRAHSHSHSPHLQPKKPILKYRTLSDILTVPRLKNLRLEDLPSGPQTPEEEFSPSEKTFSPYSEEAISISSSTAPSTIDASADEGTESDFTSTGRRKHIAFSNRVEQCIAVDSDDDRERYNNKAPESSFGVALSRTPNKQAAFYADASESDSDESTDRSNNESDEDEEEEPVLTFKSSRSSSNSSYSYGGYRNALKRTSSHGSSTSSTVDPAPLTIAKLAPTKLKDSEDLPSPSPAVVFSPRSAALALPNPESDSDFGSPVHREHASNSTANSEAPLAESQFTQEPETLKEPVVAPSRSILKAKAVDEEESSERGRPLVRGSATSSLDARSASRTASSVGSGSERRRSFSSDEESGKGRGENLLRPTFHPQDTTGADESYLDDVDLSAWKSTPTTQWEYEYSSQSGLLNIVGDAIGTSIDVVDAVYKFGRSFIGRSD